MPSFVRLTLLRRKLTLPQSSTCSTLSWSLHNTTIGLKNVSHNIRKLIWKNESLVQRQKKIIISLESLFFIIKI